MMRTRSYNQQYLILRGTRIPLSGENVSARISKGDATTVARMRDVSIVQEETNPDATLTIMCAAESAAYPLLRAIAQAQRTGIRAGARPPLPGSAGNLASAEVVAWEDAEILNLPDLVLSRETEELEFVLALHNVRET